MTTTAAICVHHWAIETLSRDGFYDATCCHCGEARRFPQLIYDVDYNFPISANAQPKTPAALVKLRDALTREWATLAELMAATGLTYDYASYYAMRLFEKGQAERRRERGISYYRSS